MAWKWVLEEAVLNAHEAQLAAHGGGIGIRDRGLLRSALARPEKIVAYGDNPEVADLAAAYASGIIRNHPFVDGNKRTAFVTMVYFLILNGWMLDVEDSSAVLNILKLAAGELSEAEFALWVHNRLTLI